MNYKKTYSCPDCDYDITIPDDCLTTDNDTCECQSCGSRFIIDWDADYEDGKWTDKTKLYPAPL